MTTPEPEGIEAVVYKSGILRRAWRFKFVAANGQKFGHQYNRKHNAVEAVRKLVKPQIPVTLIIQNEDGTTQKVRIR